MQWTASSRCPPSMGKTMSIYGDDPSAPAWDAGCTIDATCSPVASGRRRRLSSHANQTDYAVEMTSNSADGGADISQFVTDDSFETSLKANRVSEVAADASVSATIPDIPTVDSDAIAYTSTVTFEVTGTEAATDQTALTTSLTGTGGALSQSLQAVGFSPAEANTAAAAATTSGFSVTSTPSSGVDRPLAAARSP